MPFVTVPGLNGKVYVPEKQHESLKKHACKDCYYCQLCSDDRCRVCRDPKNRKCLKSYDKQLPCESCLSNIFLPKIGAPEGQAIL